MNYHIKDKRDRIASFKNESDRDYCKDMLEELYPDCVFRSDDDYEPDRPPKKG